MSAWTLEGDPVKSSGVTLVEGSTFAVSDDRGDMVPDAAHGLFFRDMRMLSTWRLRIDQEAPEALGVDAREPYSATFVCRARPRRGRADTTLVVERRRYVGAGMREDLLVRNFGREPAGLTLTMVADADFADLFEVKEGRVVPHGARDVEAVEDVMSIEMSRNGRRRGVRIHAPGAAVTPGHVTFRVVVPARGEWTASLLVTVSEDGVDVPARFALGQSVELSAPARRLSAWREGSPHVGTSYRALTDALERSAEDLGALRIHDPDHPDISVVAAGAPWFMALFGRDSLITSMMTLPFNQSLALGTAQTLARYQGTTVDPMTEEQPGRILHEMRFGIDAQLLLGGDNVYYGTADATPLFVVLLGELRRWGVTAEEVAPLMPAMDAALEWIEECGDRDGDGFVEYLRMTDRGLRNQGWKDSFDGVNYADGTLAEPPLALVEVQAYVYGAYVARAHFAREAGSPAEVRRWLAKASTLKRRFNEAFWMPGKGAFAVALDADKRQVDAVTSNMGHCLWTGIVDGDKAGVVADNLLSPQMFTGYGIRTLASSMGAYNPISYHNGSVWPHDTALCVAGLMRYGYTDHALRVISGLLEAAEFFGGRLPELFCGFERAEYGRPVPYPTSCSPQAWAAAAPVQLLRSILRLDPALHENRVWLDPLLPPECDYLTVTNLHLAGGVLTLDIRDGQASVAGVPDGIEIVRRPRPPEVRLADWAEVVEG